MISIKIDSPCDTTQLQFLISLYRMTHSIHHVCPRGTFTRIDYSPSTKTQKFSSHDITEIKQELKLNDFRTKIPTYNYLQCNVHHHLPGAMGVYFVRLGSVATSKILT